MTTRFDVERAVLASELPSSERLLMLVLLTHASGDPVTIPANYTPSLTALSRESGMDRSTVQRRLRGLETVGWVIRQSPPVAESRKGARTRYRLAVPVGAHDTYPVGAPGTQLGAQGTQGGCTCHLGVGAQNRKPRCVVHPNHPYPMSSDLIPRAGSEEVAAVVKALRDRTGKTIDEDHAALVARQILGAASEIRVSKRVYLLGAIRKDDNPARFLPTPGPPRYQREEH